MLWNSLEIWSFEMMVLLSGLLPNPKLETPVLSIRLVPKNSIEIWSAMSKQLFWTYKGVHCSLNTCSMIYVMPLGLGGAIRWFNYSLPPRGPSQPWFKESAEWSPERALGLQYRDEMSLRYIDCQKLGREVSDKDRNGRVIQSHLESI